MYLGYQNNLNKINFYYYDLLPPFTGWGLVRGLPILIIPLIKRLLRRLGHLSLFIPGIQFIICYKRKMFNKPPCLLYRLFLYNDGLDKVTAMLFIAIFFEAGA
jgi:hypothetical protein